MPWKLSTQIKWRNFSGHVTLVEEPKIHDEKEAKELEEKIKKNKFDLEDFLGQIQQIKKMGNVKDLLSMVPE